MQRRKAIEKPGIYDIILLTWFPFYAVVFERIMSFQYLLMNIVHLNLIDKMQIHEHNLKAPIAKERPEEQIVGDRCRS